MVKRILIVDHRSQYIDRLSSYVSNLGVTVELKWPLEKIQIDKYDGIIVSGAGKLKWCDYREIFYWQDETTKKLVKRERNVYDEIFVDNDHVPTLGICFGHQLLAKCYGARIVRMPKTRRTPKGFMGAEEEVIKTLKVHSEYRLVLGLREFSAYLDHINRVVEGSLPEQLLNFVSSPDCPIQALQVSGRPIYSVQWHPEVTEGNEGHIALDNFVSML